MDERAQDEPERRREWARELVAGLTAAEELDLALAAVLDPEPDLLAENDARRARAVHAAAMGLGPAGCAAAAGIPEALLAGWRARDPAFEAALAAATALAAAHRVPARGRTSALGLRLFLQSVARGASAGTSAAIVGLRSDQLLRLRRANPLVAALVDAAVQQARGLRGGERRPKRAPAYRLVTLRTPPSGPDPDRSHPEGRIEPPAPDAPG
ncbi:hypothetical protein WDV06_24645 [Streptomyces racemochromogenes]|uniref:Uncharacterized protein n=1 Tax=Streptomyces racemochromogenes TaxID=67353 RepID=A0ABW7PJZ3_9ACTN